MRRSGPWLRLFLLFWGGTTATDSSDINVQCRRGHDGAADCRLEGAAEEAKQATKPHIPLLSMMTKAWPPRCVPAFLRFTPISKERPNANPDLSQLCNHRRGNRNFHAGGEAHLKTLRPGFLLIRIRANTCLW